jgi:PAS domain S-box-containing protein
MPVSGAHILVVDDNPATRYSTCRILRGAGWTVFEAADGNEALAKAASNVDLIILDVNLPDIDGFEVCRRLRANEATERIPVVHLSGTFVNDNHKVHGLESGADGYLTHPVEPPVLIATVNAFLRTRLAESNLRQSEARFRAVFENALNGVALFDEEFALIDLNPAFCRLLDRSRDSIVNRRLADFVPADRHAEFQEIDSKLASDKSWRGVFPLERSDGQLVYLDWHMSIHNTPGLRLAIVSDITARLEYEREREELLAREQAARAAAERANSLKDDFLANLSHELRTPLNAIVGWAQLLRLGVDPSEREEGLQAIDRNANALAQMIADLLDVSRITSGKIRLDMQPLDPQAIIESALSAAVPAAEAKSIQISKMLDPQAGLIEGDPSRLQQVLTNLLNNAIKFTPSGGKIDVTLARAGSRVEIRVADNGKGIEPQYLSQIFERFEQIDTGSTREHAGLGLGLAIARQLIDLHGGTIAAHSEGNQRGATFIVSLPSVSMPIGCASDAPANPSRASQPGLYGIRVLLVEDDPDSRHVLKRLIADYGAETEAVADVAEALNALHEFRPDLLISDLCMPGRDGYELIREIRTGQSDMKDVPAIALTAFARAEDRRRALEAGFQIHVPKPINGRELAAAIASLTRSGGESR